MVPLQRAETATTAGTGYTGDSTLTATAVCDGDGAGARAKVLPHPVEPRATTAMLPPVLVR